MYQNNQEYFFESKSNTGSKMWEKDEMASRRNSRNKIFIYDIYPTNLDLLAFEGPQHEK